MKTTDILTMVFGLVMLFMPMWGAVISRVFFKKHSVKTVAVISVIPFFVWRVIKGDHLLLFEIADQLTVKRKV